MWGPVKALLYFVKVLYRVTNCKVLQQHNEQKEKDSYLKREDGMIDHFHLKIIIIIIIDLQNLI